MTIPWRQWLAAALFLASGTHLASAQAKFEVLVNESVSTSSIDRAALKDILTGKTMFWDGGQAITIIVLAEQTDAALQEASGMTASQFKTHWQRLTFSGRGKQPKTVDSADKLGSSVGETKGAIALAPSALTAPGLKKLELK